MPNTEYIQSKNTRHNDVSFSNHLRVFVLYTCPICLRYTIHAPRSDRKGDYYVDHKRVQVHHHTLDGVKKYIGLAAEDSCYVSNCDSIINIEQTRTVIRVN